MDDAGSHTKKQALAAKVRRGSHAERTELSDQLMLDAATQLILDVGTGNTTLKDIGERAGYSRGLANARFGSKDALFIRLAERCREKWISELRSAAEGKTGQDVLLSRVDAMIQFAEGHPKDARVMYILWFESVGAQSDMSASLARFHARARLDIKTLVLNLSASKTAEAETRADQYALRFCGLIFGICYQWLVSPDAVDIQKTLEGLKDQIRQNLL